MKTKHYTISATILTATLLLTGCSPTPVAETTTDTITEETAETTETVTLHTTDVEAIYNTSTIFLKEQVNETTATPEFIKVWEEAKTTFENDENVDPNIIKSINIDGGTPDGTSIRLETNTQATININLPSVEGSETSALYFQLTKNENNEWLISDILLEEAGETTSYTELMLLMMGMTETTE